VYQEPITKSNEVLYLSTFLDNYKAQFGGKLSSSNSRIARVTKINQRKKKKETKK